jgi:hypothetical protein
MLHLSGDTFAQAQAAHAMNGVAPIYPAESHIAGINLLPCRGSDDNYIYPSTFAFSASIDSYQFPRDTVERWLIGKGIVELQRYPIRHSMPTDMLYGRTSTFTCPVVSENLRQYLPAEQKAENIHGGLVIPLILRSFQSWTYRNTYDTPTSGSGTVKVFAGTFTYTLTSNIPGVLVYGAGTASIKMMLNPDTGHWETAEFSLQDPRIALQ